MSSPVKPLTADRVYRPSDPAKFGFATTADLTTRTPATIGQQRALEAIDFATGMDHFGYNLFVLGTAGSGRHAIVLDRIRRVAATRPAPDDWCYVHNFAIPHKPHAIRLTPGRARAFADAMAQFIDALKVSLPAAFESDDYRERRQALEASYQQRHEEALADLQKRAESMGAALVRTPVGFGVAPVVDGQVVNPEVFQQWPEERQDRMRQDISTLEADLARIAQEFPKWRRELSEELRRMNREVTGHAVSDLFDQLYGQYADLPAVTAWLKRASADLIEQAESFLSAGPATGATPSAEPVATDHGAQFDGFNRYLVNVIVEDSGSGQAPVVYEDHPTYPALFGRIEHQARMGALFTDYKLIKPGALHRANGGYLLLDAAKVIAQPMIWEELKRVLRSRKLRIQGIYESLGLSSTVTLEPEEVPVDVKVILIGDRRTHYLMSRYDPDVMELFKVPVDFEDSMPRTAASERRYAALIGDTVKSLGLRAFDAAAAAQVIEHAARLAGDSARLTLQLRQIHDLLREADHYASHHEAAIVSAPHVNEAVAMHTRRRDRIREHMYGQIRRGTVMVDTRGTATGQINGLSVLQVGDFDFGHPVRITARVRMGRGEIIDIERQVEMGGPLHSKGVLILAGYLGGKFARNQPLALTASLVFEQSYGGVDGDSASSAELYALLSALADAPIDQRFAVTGSVNQQGEIQPIGGVNEKIEGFFDVCRNPGLTGRQGVLIPQANVPHLMLRADVVEAIRQQQFAVYPIRTVDEGLELLTGVPAGRRRRDGSYPPATINGRVTRQLHKFIELTRSLTAPTPDRDSP